MDQPANGSCSFGEGELVDKDHHLETGRFGKVYVPAGKYLSKPERVKPATESQDNTTEKQNEKEGDARSQGDTHVPGNPRSVSNSSDPIILDSMSETGSHNEPISNEETGYNLSESNSTNLPNVENGRDQNSESKSNLEKLLATQGKYELHCPSCSSCITRKLTLKKKKHGKLVELLKSTVYGGLTETITSLVVVSSASASGSSTENMLVLAVANLAGGLIVLARNLQDLSYNSDQDKYNELLGRRDNIRMHVLVAVLSYIFFGLIAPLVYAFSFYQTGIKNYKLASVFSVSLVCVIMLGMIKVYIRKPVNVRASSKPYLKSAAYYTSIVVVSSGISYFVGDAVGEYIGKLSWY